MKLSKQNVKKLGFLPKGTYDAEIIAAIKYIDNYEDETYWLFGFNIIQKGVFCRYDHCLKYSEEPDTEFSGVMMYLRYLLGKEPGDPIDPKELSRLSITLKIGYDIEIVRTMPKKAIFRNYIEEIRKPKHPGVWLEALENKFATSDC